MVKLIEEKKYFVIVLLIFITFTYLTKEKPKEEILFSEQEKNIISEETIEEEVIFIHIAGNVNKPGVYKVEEGSRLDDVIILAGIDDIEILDRFFNRAKLLVDGEKIYVPFPEEIDKEEESFDFFEISTGDKKININGADIKDLMSLSGIGEMKARDIIAFREKNGNFKKIDDIMLVKGIGKATFEKIKDLIKT